MVPRNETLSLLKRERPEYIIIAVGTSPTRREGIPFTPDTIFTSDGLLKMQNIPKTLAVIGGGVIGIEYASIFAALGVRVTVIDMRPNLLGFVERLRLPQYGRA